MRKPLFSLLASTILVLALASSSRAQIGGHDETSENFNPGGWSTLDLTPGTVSGAVFGTHLLISEVAARGAGAGSGSDSSEYIEVYNPTPDSLILTNYYISDDPTYYRVVNGPYSLLTSTDYVLRFPSGAILAPGQAAVICVTKTGFAGSGASVASGALFFEMGNSNGNTSDDMISLGTNSAFPASGGVLTNPNSTNGEYTMLFYWNGVSDLVCDVDYASWGANGANNPKINKSGVLIDGPDSNAVASNYASDTPAGSQTNLGNGTVLTKPNTYQRTGAESGETAFGGNGCVGCPPITISPASLPSGTLKYHYHQVLTADGSQPHSFAVTSGSLPPGLTLDPNGTIDGNLSANGSFIFTVTVTGSDGCRGQREYKIAVACATITVSPAALPIAPPNQPYSATVSANGHPPHTFEVKLGSMPPGLTLDPGGKIGGSPTLEGSFSFTASATDSNGCRGTRDYKILVGPCPTITLSPDTLAPGTVKQSYRQDVTSDGTPPVTFEVKAGSLPPGLRLVNPGVPVLYGTDRNGTIFIVDLATGAGSATGVFAPTGSATEIEHDFISGATFAQGLDGTFFGQQFDILTGAPISGAVFDGGSFQGLEYVGSTLYGTFVTGPGGPSTLSILDPTTGSSTFIGPTGTGPISGLAYDAANAIMYGISGGGRAFPGNLFTLDLTSGAATVVGPTGITTGSLEFGPDGNLYAGGDLVDGGHLYRIDPSSGASTLVGSTGFFAVNGLTLGPSGVAGPGASILGTPTVEGSYTFTLSATDANGCRGQREYKIAVTCPPITISPDTLAPATMKQFYNQGLSANGSPPLTFSVTAGSPPPGLTLYSNGFISGEPTATGSYSFTVTVTDANGCRGQRDYKIMVSCPVITISPTSLPNAPVNEPYSQTLTATGYAPHTFDVKAGSLPPGLTLDPGGKIGGTPTTPGSFSFTVGATSSNGCRGTRDYKITAVICPPITILPTTLHDGTVKEPYRETLTADGTPPFTFSVKNGSLPPGLRITGSGTALYGTDRNGQIFTVDLATGAGTATGVYAPTFSATEIEHDFITGATFVQATDGNFAGQRFDITTGAPIGGVVFDGGSYQGLEYVGSILYGAFVVGPQGPSSLSILDPTTGSSTFIGPTGTGPISGLAFDATSGTMYGISGGGRAFPGQLFTINLTSGAATAVGLTGITAGSLEFGPDGNLYAGGDLVDGGHLYRIDPSSGASTLLGPTGFFAVNGLTLGPGGSGPEGIISGIPTAEGSFTFTVNLTDANGCHGHRDYKITTTCPPITLTPDSLPLGTVKEIYTQIVTPSGGTPPYAYSVSAGSLPPNLVLGTDGSGNARLLGRLTAEGSFTFTIQAVDSNGCRGAKQYTIVVSCPTITLNPTTLPDGHFNKAYSQVLTPKAGTLPFTVTVTSGSLPPGLSLKDHEVALISKDGRDGSRASSTESRADVPPRRLTAGESLTGAPAPTPPARNVITPPSPLGPTPRILFAVADDDDPAYRASIATITGGTVDYFDCRFSTPSPALLSTYDCVFSKPNFFYADRVLMGDELADYVDEGHTVILGVFSTLDENQFPGYQLQGRIMTPGYCPVIAIQGTRPFGRADYAGDGIACIHTGVVAYGNNFHDQLALQGGGIADGHYLQDGSIAHAFRPDGKVVYSNGHGAYFYGATGDWPRLIANAVECKTPPPPPIVISGIPTQEGSFTFTLSYVDRNNCPGQQEFTIKITSNPTATLLSLFQAIPVGDGLELRWQFADPHAFSVVGLERAVSTSGPWIEVAAERRTEGGATVTLDRAVESGQTYYYRLVATAPDQTRMTFGPLVATAGEQIAEFALSRVAPNPTSGLTRIDFAVARPAQVRVTVVDAQGRTMAEVANGLYRPGHYQASWTGQGDRGPVPVGLYFIRYQVEGKSLMRRLVLTR